MARFNEQDRTLLYVVRSTARQLERGSSADCVAICNRLASRPWTQDAIAFMRMAMPLLLVALHSQQQVFRTGATSRFAVWSGRSMRGISALALDAICRKEQMNDRYVGS
jgi:hypothetical protein